MGNGITIKKSNKPQRSDYYIGSIIGKGGFGILREVKKLKTNKWFAMKEYNLKENKEADMLIQNELNIFKKLHLHPFIIKFYVAFHDQQTVSFIMELLSGGDLRLAIRAGQKFDERKTAYIIGCIGSALHHLHLHNIIHRDVKPENILFNNQGVPKLIDFGISSCLTSSSFVCQSKSGTREYLAPEVLVPKTHYHGFESDFWSLGVVMYELLFRKRPYEKMAPYPMIIYSHETYQTLWLSMLSQPDILPSPTEFDSDSTTSLIHVDQPQISSLYQVKQKFCKINDTPLNNNLIFDIPKTTSIGDLISLECHNMLLSLLDVRIQKRLGAHERYSDFIDHNWFANVSIPTSSLEKYQSPININLDYVGEYIWEKYSKLDLISSIEHFAESQVQLPEHEKIDFSHFELPYVAPI
mmetsp:Transcript_5682/g.5860  ORF Transcript_5682/g.5860 Transcript_5682/m.5860 type:complete len:411 (-) Transcript_5682:518-1750(-)